MQQQSLVQNRRDELSSTTSGISLGRVVFSLSAITVCTKVFGFAEKLVIAHFFGTTDTADVYFASMGIVLSIVFLIKELIYPSLLPVFADTLSSPTHVSGGLFKKVFLSTIALLVAIAIIQAAFSDILTDVLVPGFSGPKKQLTSSMLRMLAVGMLFLALSTVAYTVLNVRKKFLKAAWPETAQKLFIVAGLVLLLPFLGFYAFSIVVGLGAMGCLLTQLYFIPDRKFLFNKQNISGTGDHFRKVLLLMGPLVIGVIFSHISGLVDNVLASTLPSGHLSYLGYARKLIDAILLVGPVALVTVIYSQLSYFASSKNYAEFKRLVIRAFRLLVYITVPIGCLLIGLRQPLIRFLFERGQFSTESTVGTSQAFMIYAFGLVTFSLEGLVVYSFFALSNTKTPVKVGILCVCLDIVLAILSLRPFGYLGIAGALVISKTIKIIILFANLNRRLKGLFGLELLSFSAKLIVATIASLLVLKLQPGIAFGNSFFSRTVFDLILPLAGALLAFVLASHLLRIDEFKEIISLLMYRKAAISWFRGEVR